MSAIFNILDQLSTPKAELPKAPIETNIKVAPKIEKVGKLLGQTELVLNRKVVHVSYKNASNGQIDGLIKLKTTHWFIASIMNVFAKIFPSCVQGAAVFSIKDLNNKEQVCYIRRSRIQKALPQAEIQRSIAFQGNEQQNTIDLKAAAKRHFLA